MVKSIAKIKVKEDRAGDFIGYVTELAEITRTEAGCLFYELYQLNDEPAVFYFVEEWETRQDLQKHIDSAHVANFSAKASAVTDGDVQPVDWTRVV